MKIIDVHNHISINKQKTLLNCYADRKHFLSAQKDAQIECSICFINPFVTDLLCPVNYKHKIMILDDREEYIKLFCTDCKDVFYTGKDPLRWYNEQLVSQFKKDSSVKLLAYLNISRSNINYEIDYYENKYYDEIIGYKLHPTISNRSISEIDRINTRKPMLFHSGVEDVANPLDIIEFSKRYEGNIIIAHCARFNEKALKQIKEFDNIYIDVSPISFLYQLTVSKPHRLFDTSWLGAFSSPIELFDKLVRIVPLNKILFGSDYPFVTSIIKEVDIFQNNSLFLNEAFYKNAKTAFYLV